MLYDLDVALEYSREMGFSTRRYDQIVEVDLGNGALLAIQNLEQDQDCLIGFLRTPWHGHGNLMFDNGSGQYIELDYLDILTGLKEGHVLVCERWVDGALEDRWLTHDQYNDDLRYLEEGERIVIRRAVAAPP